MKRGQVWIETDHWDDLAKYYNENHDEIRAHGIRNFGHWLGVLAYVGFRDEPKNRVRNQLMRVIPRVTMGGRNSYSISPYAFASLIDNLWEAIGEEDPRVTPCKKCSEVCRAYTSTNGKCPEIEGVA